MKAVKVARQGSRLFEGKSKEELSVLHAEGGGSKEEIKDHMDHE